ncbi:hypothetical protein CSA37_08180 [Candidatus Fermentibacteria bacterium]|nr:MAG: hypothetical protein CSA37_08180 [Candidatus Fermentibacteria bacterium]
MKGSNKTEPNFVHKLGFSAADAFHSASYGFNARNIWICWKGLLSAWITWLFFSYAGFLAAGDNIGDRFSSAILCPLPDRLFISSVPAVVIGVAGILLSLYILLFTSLKVSRMTFEQIRGDQFYTGKDAGTFAQKFRRSLVLAPLTVLAGVAVAAGFIALAGLAGIIPGVGQWIIALVSLPAWMLGILLLYGVIVLVLSFFLTPAIIASTSGDGFECVFEIFSITAAQPFRIFKGILAGLLVRIPVLLLLVAFAWGGLAVTGMVMEYTGNTLDIAGALESGFASLAPDLVPLYSSIFSPVSSLSETSAGFSGFPGIMLSASGTAVMLFFLSYWFSSGVAMWQLIYLGARHERDGEDLLLRAEEDEYREFRKLYGSTDHAGDRKSKSR